jgi:ribonuclease P protein component
MRRGDEFSRAVRSGFRTGRDTVVMHVVWGTPMMPVHPQSGDEAVDDAAPRRSDAARVGFIVSRAVGSSVVRSRVKRRLRHLMRDRVGRFPDRSLVVVRATPRAASAPSAVLASELDAMLDKVQRSAERRGAEGGGPTRRPATRPNGGAFA